MRTLRLLAACVVLLCLGAIGQAVHAAPKAVFGIPHPAYSCDYADTLALCGGESVSSASLATIQDTSGNITYIDSNALLNSATLSTQNVTSQPINYLLLIYGTGSVTLSGTASGTLSGTGANNRVCLAFTPTAGTLTLTVSGSVTSAQLVAVTYQTCATNPLPTYLASAGSEAFGPALDDGEVCVGLRSEEARTNLALDNTAMAASPWLTSTAVTGTITQTANGGTAPDGSGAAAKIVIGRTVAATDTAEVYQSFTGTAAAYTGSFYVEAFGAGDVGKLLWIDGYNGTSSTISPAITLTSGWQRVPFTATMAASASAHFGIGYIAGTGSQTGTVNFLLYYGQFELGSNATSVIPTAASAVTRAADIITATGTFAAAYKAPSMSAVAEFVSYNLLNNPTAFSSTGNFRNVAILSNGVPTLADFTLLELSSVAVTTNQVIRIGDTYIGSYRAITASGRITSDSGGEPSGASVYLGSSSEGASFIDGCIRKIAIWNHALPNSLLQQKSNVAPGPITWLFPSNDNWALEERRRAA